MIRREFLIGCCVFPWLGSICERRKSRKEPTLADPVPPGFTITIRGMIGKDEHVVFENQEKTRYRIYINGKFDCEGRLHVYNPKLVRIINSMEKKE